MMSFNRIDDIRDALQSEHLSVRALYSAWGQRRAVVNFDAKRVGVTDSGAPTAGEQQIPWLQDDAALARLFTDRGLEKEEFLLVCDAAREALDYWTGNGADRLELISIRMNYAAALTRLGSTRTARAELELCLRDDDHPRLARQVKANILMQIGDILREESHRAHTRAERVATAEEALTYYKEALVLQPDRLEVLSATATLSLILSEPGSPLRQQAETKAEELLGRATRLESINGPRQLTTWARADAHSILGNIDRAVECYREMPKIEGVTTAHLAEIRYRAQFLAEALGLPREFFKPAFPPLQLVVFAGHLPDRPGHPGRFPASLIDPVRDLIRAKLEEHNVTTAMVSAAAGADLLFIEALLERHGTVHVVLPWSQREFLQTSVRQFEPPGTPGIWEPLFQRAMADAATVRELGQLHKPSNDVSWQYMLEVMAGMALLLATNSRLDVQPMALWDGHPGQGSGRGTSSFMEFWRQQLRRETIQIPMPLLQAPRLNVELERVVCERTVDRCEHATVHQEVKTMLFADIVGYSKLTEHSIAEFIENFLRRLSLLAVSSNHPPRCLNTWGDAIFAVFDFATDAGRFAIEIIQMIDEGQPEWLQKGLYWEEPRGEGADPIIHPLSMRIGLHTGPVFMHYDPVVRRLDFTGTHVSRAARIEPVATPGQIFASEEFAAMVEFSAELACLANGGQRANLAGLICEYAGTMALAKGYVGRYRIYRVLPKWVFAIEDLAQAAHESYCVEAIARGETPHTNSALKPWAELSDDLRDANRAQVGDILNKLRRMDYELAPIHGILPTEINMTDEQIEELAIREHDRWMRERERQGWTFASKRDNARRHHPLLVRWDQLSEIDKEKDRAVVRNVPQLIERAGYRLRKITFATRTP
jgi:class 3 adenylate cyclase/tetratricopeptide (TPR) repeat protein